MTNSPTWCATTVAVLAFLPTFMPTAQAVPKVESSATVGRITDHQVIGTLGDDPLSGYLVAGKIKVQWRLYFKHWSGHVRPTLLVIQQIKYPWWMGGGWPATIDHVAYNFAVTDDTVAAGTGTSSRIRRNHAARYDTWAHALTDYQVRRPRNHPRLCGRITLVLHGQPDWSESVGCTYFFNIRSV